MSLEPGMITDGRVPGARSVPGGRRPCLLTCAPLNRRNLARAGGRVQTEFRSRSGFRMWPLYTSVRMLEGSRKAPLCATLCHVFDDRFGWTHSLQVQWASTNGNRARRSSAMAHASGACHQEAPRQIDGFVHYVFSSLFRCTRRGVWLSRCWPGSGLRQKMARPWRWDARVPSKRCKALAWDEIGEWNVTIFGQIRLISSHFVSLSNPCENRT